MRLTPLAASGRKGRMRRIIPNFFVAAVIIACGCTAQHPSDKTSPIPEKATPAKPISAALEGSWRGREVTPGQEGPATLAFSGNTMDFHGAQQDDWCKGTVELHEDVTPNQLVGTITDCNGADAIGKKVYAIYKVENDTLTISGNGPGDTEFPSAFDAAGARRFILKRD